MIIWDRCAICDRIIPVGELCYGIKNWRGDPEGGRTICKNCIAPENVDSITPPNDMDLGFDVIDTKTREYPDLEKIALTEEWAQGLVYCDMDGFAVREGGSLILLDECGNCVSCPPGRFEIRLQDGGDSTEGQIAMKGMKDGSTTD